MAVTREVFQNNSSTTLNGAITASTNPITVTNGAVFPSTGKFRILIGSEILLCTAVSGNSLTVSRGQENTTAASHTSGSTLKHLLTKAGVDAFAKESIYPYANSSSRLPYHRMQNQAGTILTASDFTWYNQQSSTATDQDGGLLVKVPALTTNQMRFFYRAAPSTPYTLTVCLDIAMIGGSDIESGIAFRQSSSDKFSQLCYMYDNGDSKVVIDQWTDFDSFSSSPFAHQSQLPNLHWLRIADDGTNTIYYVSHNGVNWFRCFSQSRTTFFTGTGPNQIGICISNENTGLTGTDQELITNVLTWSES